MKMPEHENARSRKNRDPVLPGFFRRQGGSMKYIDRKGNITIEETGQDRLLKKLYNQKAGKFTLKILTRPALSVVGGLFLSCPLSVMLIPGFIRRNHINMAEYEPQVYKCYNDFFIRKIRKEFRPVCLDEKALISPCDGKVTAVNIGQDQHLMIKGRDYTLNDLLKSETLAARYTGGYAILIRLTVDNYHHFCYPVEGRRSAIRKIPGSLHTVNPAANELYPIYAENQREYCILHTRKFGNILQMEVGALMVGKIKNLQKGSCYVKKGQEKGWFAFGGSSVLLLLPPGRASASEDLLKNTKNGYETIIRQGERIGECKKLPKRA